MAQAAVVVFGALVFFIFVFSLSGSSKARDRSLELVETFINPDEYRLPKQSDEKTMCDKLIQEYDKNPDGEVCRRIREECQLPCATGRTFLDVVYLWANGSDPVYASYQRKIGVDIKSNSAEWSVCMNQALSPARSRELGTFRFSLRSIFSKLEFVRRVFIITPLGQVPDFVDTSHPRVRMVDTRDVVPSKIVSFNSNAIQFFMHTIPTLSDPFITMNDDFLVLKPMALEDFISRQGVAKYKLDWYFINGMRGCWGRLIDSTARHANEVVKGVDFRVAAHQPLTVKHDVASFILKRWPSLMQNISRHSVRHVMDVSFDSFHIWVGDYLKLGQADVINFECKGTHSLTAGVHVDLVIDSLISPPPCTSLALNDDFEDDVKWSEIEPVNAFLEFMYPEPSPMEKARPKTLEADLQYTCLYSREPVDLDHRAFIIPSEMNHMHSSAFKREVASINSGKKSVAELNEQFGPLDYVDVGNPYVRVAPVEGNTVRVAVSNLNRGKYWCEFSQVVQRTKAVYESDFMFLNGLDLGMARSNNVYAARRTAYALRRNYAFGVEFLETTRGSTEEQIATEGKFDQWGLQGHAILSKWKIVDKALVRFPENDQYFRGSDLPGEKKLGGKMALFAIADVKFAPEKMEKVTLIVLRLTGSRYENVEYVNTVVKMIADKVNSFGHKKVILGGDMWPLLCEKLGFRRLVFQRSSVNMIDDSGNFAFGPRWRDDYACARGFAGSTEPEMHPSYFQSSSAVKVAVGDHPIISLELMLEKPKRVKQPGEGFEPIEV